MCCRNFIIILLIITDGGEKKKKEEEEKMMMIFCCVFFIILLYCNPRVTSAGHHILTSGLLSFILTTINHPRAKEGRALNN